MSLLELTLKKIYLFVNNFELAKKSQDSELEIYTAKAYFQ